MFKRLLVAAVLVAGSIAAIPASASPFCDFMQNVPPDLMIGDTGYAPREEIGYDCVYVVYLDGEDLVVFQASDEVQRLSVILGPQHGPLFDGDQDVVVKNQVGCCVEVDTNGYIWTIDRTGVFGGDEYFTVFVDGRKRLICPWTPEDGPQLDECELDTNP